MVKSDELSKMELFRGFPKEIIEEVANVSEILEYKKGDIIFNEGDDAERIFALLDGEIEIYIQLSTRPDKILLSITKLPYETFGWSALVAPHYYTTSCACREDTKVISIKRTDLLNITERDPSIGMMIYKRIATVISNRLRNCRALLLKTIY